MWGPLLTPGLGLLDGRVHDVRALAQELTHFAVHERRGAVLWCDGDHGFNPYDFAEINLTRGFAADDGAARVLVKRCMTPFQWDTVLTKHLATKLSGTETCLVLALPYDRLFSTDELSDWEQEDYVRFSLEHLRDLAARRGVPILLGVDVALWRVARPGLAKLLDGALDRRWALRRGADGHEVLVVPGGEMRDRRQATLRDYEARTRWHDTNGLGGP